MLLGVISCSLCSARHDYRRPFVVADDVPVALLGQPEGEAANVRLRVGGTGLAGNRITTVPGVFREVGFLDRASLGEWWQRRARGSFLQSASSNGLYLFRNRALLRQRTRSYGSGQPYVVS